MSNPFPQVPQLLVNGEITENCSRIEDNVFDINGVDGTADFITARIISTDEKYNSELSDPIACFEKPGVPKILSTRKTDEHTCRIWVKFPDNVDIKDTYEYFVSF